MTSTHPVLDDVVGNGDALTGRLLPAAVDGREVPPPHVRGLAGSHEPVRDRELWLLYVLAAHHGTGAGQALLDTALPPGTPAQLWVAEANPRARRFYERNGFLPDGARFVDEGLHLAEVRHVR
ncbi:GNAT family N-acetyltransferase [Isoptericola sp. NPDC057191]|uniref:GNAT family N-acetyltransferase n=1 Tax=Isoptericola sp. NPDC057191 TaxID=3346041 RepID=UPI00362F23FD